jgi:hypothetical protein
MTRRAHLSTIMWDKRIHLLRWIDAPHVSPIKNPKSLSKRNKNTLSDYL